jgi:hypothetical protein
MRRGRRALASVGLVLLAACAGSAKGAVVTTRQAATSTVAAATGTVASAATTISTAAGASTTTTAAAGASTTATPAVASIVPEVVCVGSPSTSPRPSGNPRPDADEPVYFGYTSSATVPVAVPKGSDNLVEATPSDDDPLAPTVFVPGHVSPAFLTYVAEANDSLPTWTVRGPDGVVRTATITASSPACTDELVKAPFPDTRQATLSFAATTLPAGSAQPNQVELVSTLLGLPALSVCPTGLEQLAPFVTVDDVAGGALTTGPVGRQALTLFQVSNIGPAYLGARANPVVFVVDRCRGAGTVTFAWPTSTTLVALRQGTPACIKVDGAQATVFTSGDDCQTLAYTGGVRTRRPTPQG